jgi:hypothetical protein
MTVNEKHVTTATDLFLCDFAPLRLCVSILCFFFAENAMKILRSRFLKLRY